MKVRVNGLVPATGRDLNIKQYLKEISKEEEEEEKKKTNKEKTALLFF